MSFVPPTLWTSRLHNVGFMIRDGVIYQEARAGVEALSHREQRELAGLATAAVTLAYGDIEMSRHLGSLAVHHGQILRIEDQRPEATVPSAVSSSMLGGTGAV